MKDAFNRCQQVSQYDSCDFIAETLAKASGQDPHNLCLAACKVPHKCACHASGQRGKIPKGAVLHCAHCQSLGDLAPNGFQLCMIVSGRASCLPLR